MGCTLQGQVIVVGDALHFYDRVTSWPPHRTPGQRTFELEFETLCGNARDHAGEDAASISARMEPSDGQLRDLRVCRNCRRSRCLTPELREFVAWRDTAAVTGTRAHGSR